MPSAMIFAARASSGLAARNVAGAALPALTLGSRPARPQLGHRVCRSPIARSSGFHSSAASSTPSASYTSAATSASTSWADSILSTFDPLIPYVHSLPEYLHLSGSPHGYALSIVVLTFFLRSTITLPFQLWARKRQARLQEEVMPRWNVLKGKDGLPLTRMKEARRQGKPFEVYKKELEEDLRSRLRSLIKEHRAEQWKTILIPISVSLPLFIVTTITLRQGCLPPSPLLSEILPWSMTPQIDESLARSFEASAQMLRDRGMDPEALARLSQMPGGPTLGDKDSTVLGPIAVGMLSMLNAEVAARGRGRALEEAKKAKRREQEGNGEKKEEEGEGLEAVTGKVERAELINQAISTGMRGFSILFIPISLNAPGALLIYWLSSITYSIGYNVITSFLSARKRKMRLTGPAQEEEARRVARIEDEVRAGLAEEEQTSRREMLARKGVTVDLARASAAAAAAADASSSSDSDSSTGPTRPRPTSPPSTFSNVAPNPSATFTFPQAAERPPKTAKRKARR